MHVLFVTINSYIDIKQLHMITILFQSSFPTAFYKLYIK